jgi:hypothetical protein
MIFFHIYVLLAMKFSEAIYRAVHIFNSSNNYELFANLIGTMEVGPAPPLWHLHGYFTNENVKAVYDL